MKTYWEILDETFESNGIEIQKRDVLVITEKVAALTQGRIVNLSQYSEVSENAEQIAQEYNLDPRLVELILSESSHVFGGVQGMLLTVNSGIFIANAGIDHSNAGEEDDLDLIGPRILMIYPHPSFLTLRKSIILTNLVYQFLTRVFNH